MMRRGATAVLAAVLAAAVLGVPALAGTKSRAKGPSGIDGTVVTDTCAGPCCAGACCTGPCIYPPPPSPTYTGGDLTVTVSRTSDGRLMATMQPTDGRFRLRLRRGIYVVTASLAQPVPRPQPQSAQSSAATPTGCGSSDSQQVRVRRHRFTHVELHVSNSCVVQPTA